MQESGPGSSDIHSVLNPNINRSSGFINKNQTQLYKSKMYVRLWVTQPWQWDIFHTTLTPDIGSKKHSHPHMAWQKATPLQKNPKKSQLTWPMCRQFSRPTTSILLSPISYKRINNIQRIPKKFPKESENFSLLQIWPTCTAPLRSMRSPREEVELYSLVAKLS